MARSPGAASRRCSSPLFICMGAKQFSFAAFPGIMEMTTSSAPPAFARSVRASLARRRAKDARTDLAKAGGAELVVISIMPGNAAKENCFAPIQMKSGELQRLLAAPGDRAMGRVLYRRVQQLPEREV